MKSSGSSSATRTPAPPSAPSRKAFALTGRSVRLDPRSHAVRPDLADIRLADQVFAPHYAASVERSVASAAVLRSARDPQSEPLVTLAPGERFELLDLIGDTAWGRAANHDLVGYVPLAALV